MKNFERTKKDICQQIIDMSKVDLRDFLEIISYCSSDNATPPVDLSRCFLCDD